MSEGQIIAAIIITAAFLLHAVSNKYRVDELGKAIVRVAGDADERVDDILDMVASLADKVAQMESRLDKMENELDIKKEALEEETRRMREFNDGVNGILAFGKDIPKLNKDAAKR